MSIEKTVRSLREKNELTELLYSNGQALNNECRHEGKLLSQMKVEAIKKHDALAGRWKIKGKFNSVRPSITDISLHREISDYKPLDQILPTGGYGNILMLEETSQNPEWSADLRRFSDYEIVFRGWITAEEFTAFCNKYSITLMPSKEFIKNTDEEIARKEEQLVAFRMLKQLLCR